MRSSGREPELATLLTLLAGGLMVWAGYVLATGSVATASWIALAGWVPIEVAFALIRRADRAAGWLATSRAARVREEVGLLVAGAVMLLAGYAVGAWSWLLAVPLAVALVVTGGFTIAGAELAGHHPDSKRRLVRAVERYIVNPPTKAALSLGVPMPLILLETTGRRTGKARRTPVMNGAIGDELWIVAEHGRHAGYVRNLLADPRVRVKRGRRWREGRAEVLDEDDPLARTGWIAEQLGRSKKMELLATRAFCVDPVTVRIYFSDAVAPVRERRRANQKAS